MKQQLNKYTKKLRERRHKYIVRNAAKAVNELICSSKIVSINLKGACANIAQKMNLNRHTVLTCYRRLFKEKKQPRKTKNFTYLFERYVAVSIACMSEVGKHFTMSDVLAIFCGVTSKGKPLPSLHFLYGWLKRHSDLVKLSQARMIESGRIATDLQYRCIEFVNILNEYQKKISFHEDIIINADETFLDSTTTKRNINRVHSTNQKHAFIVKSKRRETRGMVTFCNAAGDILLNVLSKPAGNTKKPEKREKLLIGKQGVRKRRVLNQAYAWTAKGWITKSVWKQSVELFVKIMKRHFPGRQVVLIIDKLAAHMDLDIVHYLYKNGVYCFFLPKKSSHILQPLDQFIFGNFKNLLRKKILKFRQSHGSDTKVPFDTLIMEAAEEGFTRKVVCKSFEVIGLHPFSSSKMIAKINENSPKKLEKSIDDQNDEITTIFQKKVSSQLQSQQT